MTSSDSEPQDPKRPALQRLLHALGEAVLGLALGGGAFIGIWELLCSTPYRCDDFKGLAYMIFSLIAAILICGLFFTLCRTFRLRLKTRYRLDAIVAVITVGIWAWYLIKYL